MRRLDDFIHRLRLRSSQTASTYVSILRKFPEIPSEKQLIDHFDRLIKSGASNATLNTHYNALKVFFDYSEVPFPLKRSEVLRGAESIRPIFSYDEIKRLISTSLIYGDIYDKAYIALAVTYGLRRGEIAGLRKEDIKGTEVFIKTLKGGTARTHLVPEQIKGYLIDLRDSFQTVSSSMLRMRLLRLMDLARIEKDQRDGWHNIRRALVTELIKAGVSLEDVGIFLRWKPFQTAKSIVLHYYLPDLTDLDRRVFKVHPFLKLFSMG